MLIGFGDVARRLLPTLIGIADVTGVSRRPETLPDSLTHRIFGDYTQPASLSEAAALKPDYVIFTPVPVSRDIDGYRAGYSQSSQHICEAGILSHCERAFFVSSTRVYAEKEGGWVTEASRLAAGDPFVDALLLGEACFRRYAATTVIRPSGLYDGARPIMLQSILEGLGSRFASGFTNRIHRDDVAGALAHLICMVQSGDTIPATLNISDDEPATTADLEAWCFEQLGREPAGLRDNQPRANRRISNAVLRSIGFTLSYPTFREGYKDALILERSR